MIGDWVNYRPGWMNEDERIRKGLIQYLESDRDCQPCQDASFYEEAIAWLEKQKDINCLACDQHLKGYLAGRKATEEERQKEQKPAEWSEEDEKMLCRCILHLEVATSGMPLAIRDSMVEEANWLKSLRNRYTWKPSEEQMEALCSKLPVVKGGGDKVQDILESLFNDLKKL